MRVLADTNVWSAGFRYRDAPTSPAAKELRRLILGHRVAIIGPVRQEVLCGIGDRSEFAELVASLAAFEDIELITDDYVTAARYYNLCRTKGVQGSNTDFLICAVAIRKGLPIFTLDGDFAHFAKYLPIELHSAEGRERSTVFSATPDPDQ